MDTVTEMDFAEEQFYADFKNLCTEAKGDHSTIVKKIDQNTATMSPQKKAEIEKNIQGYLLNSVNHRQN